MRGLTTLAHLGAAIRAEREAAGLRQDELAARARVSRATIIALESGSRFEAATLLAVMKGLDLAIELVPTRRKAQTAAPASDASNYDAAILDDTEEL